MNDRTAHRTGVRLRPGLAGVPRWAGWVGERWAVAWGCRCLLGAILAVVPPGFGAGWDAGHSLLAGVLSERVKDGGVDYAGLRAEPGRLIGYLDAVAEVREADFRTWSESEQIALLCNLYNAATLDLVVRHFPVASIRDIGGVLSGPWRQEFVRWDGRRVSLDDIEHRMLRRWYREPRIHFALVCAARSCPPLRSEPYLGGRLSEQLDDQARRFLAQADRNRVDVEGRTLHLSPIFDWYREDFIREGRTVSDFVAGYLSLPAGGPGVSEVRGYRVRYTAYDWRLNVWVRGAEGR